MKAVQESIEASVAAAASKATGAGSAVSIVGWLTSSNFGMWAGIVIGVAGLIVNAYFKHRSDKRASVAHAAYMRKMESPINHAVLPEPMEADE
jgi:hypothetical protein